MSVPLCFPPEGLPMGTHFAAVRGADALLLGLAYQLEEARPWKGRFPPYSIPALFP
jgi:amidase